MAHPTDSVKFFDGTATYTKTLTSGFKSGERRWLGLGDVMLDGNPQGTLWKAPCRVDAKGVFETRAKRDGGRRDQPVHQPCRICWSSNSKARPGVTGSMLNSSGRYVRMLPSGCT